MLLKEVIGQNRCKQVLRQLVHSGRMPHSLLLLGSGGTGNLPLALALAQLLQCESPPADGDDACGSCPACRKAAQFAHPDIHFSFPTVGPNAVSTTFGKEWRAALAENPYLDPYSWLQRLGAENKQGNITRDECQAIVKKLSLKAFEGRYKILILWMPEYLGKEGNRLLKLIEEPPEQTVFLLVAENAELILNTILSRCQLVKTDALSDDEVTDGLVARRGLDEDRARQIAFLSDGDFNQALAMADHADHDDATLLLDWLRKCWRGNGVELVKWCDAFARLGRENQKQFLHYGLHFLREMLSLVATGNTRLRLRPDEYQTAANMAKVMNVRRIELAAKLFNDNIFYIERNANPKILFLDTSIRLHQILKGSV
jgi:DNA polymerase-3 subunit delta'